MRERRSKTCVTSRSNRTITCGSTSLRLDSTFASCGLLDDDGAAVHPAEHRVRAKEHWVCGGQQIDLVGSARFAVESLSRRAGFQHLTERCNAVWHCVALFPNHAPLPVTSRRRFVRRIIVRDDVIGLFQSLLICWLKVRFLPGSPILRHSPSNWLARKNQPSVFALRARLNQVDSFRAHHLTRSTTSRTCGRSQPRPQIGIEPIPSTRSPH
jgi:hypothetical protein